MGMIYQWKPEARVKVAAQLAGEELERIRTWNNGRLEPEAVVRESAAPGAPLHDEFEWNNRAAAECYRLDQARYLIRSIGVVVDRDDEDARPVRAFVSVQRDEDRSYTSTAHALADPELRAQVIAQAWCELEAWRKRHAELIELARVFTVIDQARPAK